MTSSRRRYPSPKVHLAAQPGKRSAGGFLYEFSRCGLAGLDVVTIAPAEFAAHSRACRRCTRISSKET